MKRELISIVPKVDILDAFGFKVAKNVFLNKKKSGEFHKAVHLYLFNEKDEILLQKRAANLDHYPNKYSISLTGHVDSG